MTESSKPAARRMKTYTGSQGYVYQYYFVGRRPALPGFAGGPATEFIFDVTADRKTTFAVSVFLPTSVFEAWATKHGRPLNEAEQYGCAKLRLFQGFDEIENMMAEGRALTLDQSSLDSIADTLGLN